MTKHAHRALHPKATENTFFSCAHGTVCKTHYVLGHKASLRKFKESDVISNIFSDNNATKSAIKYKKYTAKSTNTWRLNNTLLNNKWITGGNKKYTQTNENENMTIQNLWDAGKAALHGNFIVIHDYFRKQEKSQPTNLNLYLKQSEKEEQSQKLVEGKKS